MILLLFMIKDNKILSKIITLIHKFLFYNCLLILIMKVHTLIILWLEYILEDLNV